jgi:hypothetical protein
MTISGTPSRAISTAWAWRSWCGAKRRRTPASRATRRSSERAAAAAQWAPARGAVDDAEQRPDWQLDPRFQPRCELLPGPVVHADLAAAAALAAPHQQRAATRVQVGLGERERLVYAPAGAPQHDDQAARSASVDAVAGAAHDRDDLLDRRWVGRVARPLVARRPTGVKLRQRGR